MFFGKHVYGQPDDFPDIELPPTIEKSQIRLVSPEDGQKKQKTQKSLVYVNMIGWIENDKAEFIFVVFKNGGEHQYDYFINFLNKNSTRNFELDKIEYEKYAPSKAKKSNKVAVYKEGKYLEN